MGSRVIALAAVVLVGSAATYAKGIDVSNHQGSSIDWPQVAGAGYTFAFAKASEGTTFTDATYALNRSSANAAGILVGAYHFARPAGSSDATIAASAIAQADHFLAVAQPHGGDLPPVLDLETTGGLKQPALVKWTQAWLDEVFARTGASALIYASPSFWKSALGDTGAFALAGRHLWVAHWTSAGAPTVPAGNWGGLGWTFWQWSDCQKIPGIAAKCVDGDRANGPDATVFTLASFPTGAPVSATSPTVVGTPRAGIRLAAVPGTWSGGKPIAFTYQWQSCDASGACTAIPGATLETYVPTSTDIGRTLVVTVSASTKSASASATSAPTAVVAAANGATPPAALAPPAITGNAQVGQTLTTSTGTWSSSPTSYAYQWQRCDAATAACTPIDGATGSTYVLTPGDLGAAIEVVVTATNAVGSQAAASTATAAVAAAPLPAATVGSAAAPPGQAGAVVSADGAATVTWQPGSVPTGTVVGLTATATPTTPRLNVALTPQVNTLPWPVDVGYATAPTGDVVGFSTDGARTWSAVPDLASPSLPAGVLVGAYGAGGVQHVLTRRAGIIGLFVPNAWGDPRKISRFAPRLRRVAPIRVKRLRSGVLVISTRMSTPSQILFTPGHRRILGPGSFPVRIRVASRTRRVRLTALDPYGRRARFTLSFRAP